MHGRVTIYTYIWMGELYAMSPNTIAMSPTKDLYTDILNIFQEVPSSLPMTRILHFSPKSIFS